MQKDFGRDLAALESEKFLIVSIQDESKRSPNVAPIKSELFHQIKI